MGEVTIRLAFTDLVGWNLIQFVLLWICNDGE